MSGRKVLGWGLGIMLLLVSTPEASGCRFTIREIGYTPLRLQIYIMELEADTTRYHDLVRSFRTIADDMEATTNIHYRIRDTKDADKGRLVLRNDRGIVLAEKEVFSAGEIRSFYEKVLFSPLQRAFRRQTGNVFAFLVGFYDERDTAVDRVVESTLEHFRKLAHSLDKPADQQILKVMVPPEERAKEEIILRAAGVDPYVPRPVVMVIYGRGRLAGPPLVGKGITREKLLKQLVMLGTDCECGIDLSPLLKRAIPLQWTANMDQKVADMLGFDVGNPMVLNEMSQILSKEPMASSAEALSIAPRSVDLDKVFGASETSSSQKNNQEMSRPFRYLLYTGGAILLMVITGMGYLFFRNRNS